MGVTDGLREIKIRLCGIDAPEIEQPMGIEARDHWRNLIDQGDGTLIVLQVERDRYGRTVAEIFVPLTSTEEEMSLTGQMVLDGFAYHYERYSDTCPNGSVLARVGEQAKAAKLGVWADTNAVKPWDYRR
ncbi:thermonuclease family protein [Oscillatoria sp. CS-180]|uniref:thermonuclease family protein n=1 Tax=Oscillatoria sp. CS-180 TaxID=3021720 RepID=UPI00232E5EB9|nr:thermonuclease family protein [Oscillatoria sp. CS-180]MDB9529934.1 thermonuclease family protein [Oscillatoria sp. CS-180]